MSLRRVSAARGPSVSAAPAMTASASTRPSTTTRRSSSSLPVSERKARFFLTAALSAPVSARWTAGSQLFTSSMTPSQTSMSAGCRARSAVAVAVHEAGEPPLLRKGEEPGQKAGVEGAFPARDGDAPDEGDVSGNTLHRVLRRHPEDARGGVVGAGADAAVAPGAERLVPDDTPVDHREGARRAARHAVAAVDAHPLRLGIVAVGAGDVAALHEDGGPAARAVHRAEGDDSVDRSGVFHAIRTLRSASRFTS